jgi:NAD(P)-binding Rossmann-like domain
MSESLSRREFVRRSAGWTALLCAAPLGGRWAFAGEPPRTDADAMSPIDDFADFARVVKRGRFAFADGFQGDNFERPHQAIVNRDALLAKQPGGKLPDPAERVPVVVIGGGLGGLAVAWQLRDKNPVILEQAPRFGGNAQGEKWRDSTYAVGAAYFIHPDEGSGIETLYQETGAMEGARRLEGVDPVEHRGRIYKEFWKGESSPGDEEAFKTYAARMHEFVENYPEIPLLDEEGREALCELDRRSLADVVKEWLGGSVPPPLQAAIQNYCWSSLGAGWGELSAAAGINFLAGEEFGVMVQPGGNAWIARAILSKLRESVDAKNLRTNCIVFDVRAVEGGVRIAYLDPKDQVRVIEAKAAVFACPKFVVKCVLGDLEADRKKAIEALAYRGYLVLNVLLKAPVDHDFYDLYLLRDAAISGAPGGEGKAPGRITDVILGNWSRRPKPATESVLTLYWPLPFEAGRADILFRKDAWDFLQPLAEKQILEILPILGIKPEAVEQVRMARWGHALPVAKVGFIADGHADVLRRPIGGRIFFVNQDNWALPAIETSLTEAIHFAPQIRAAIG